MVCEYHIHSMTKQDIIILYSNLYLFDVIFESAAILHLGSWANIWTWVCDAFWCAGSANGATGCNAIGWTENRKMVQFGGWWRVNLSSSQCCSSSLPGLLWFTSAPGRYKVSFLSVDIIGRMWAAPPVVLQTLTFLFEIVFCYFGCCFAVLVSARGRRDVQYSDNSKTICDHTRKVFMATNVPGSVRKGSVYTVCLCVPFSAACVNAAPGSLFPSTSAAALYRPAHFPLDWMVPARSLNVYSRWQGLSSKGKGRGACWRVVRSLKRRVVRPSSDAPETRIVMISKRKSPAK